MDKYEEEYIDYVTCTEGCGVHGDKMGLNFLGENPEEVREAGRFLTEEVACSCERERG